MMRALLVVCGAMLLAGCGVKRPLIAPKDIPAHEERLQKKRERVQQNQDEIDNAPAANKVTE